MSTPIFITGTGTGVGKTLVAAIVAEALDADYWKPVQAGRDEGPEGTDTEWVGARLSHPRVHAECYSLDLAASPHISARRQGVRIDPAEITTAFGRLNSGTAYTVVEGAGGLLVPLNERDFMSDLARALGARVILVSRHYLGSINHSLLTAAVCRQQGLDVLGWVFNDRYMDYEEEIVGWSGFPRIGSVPFTAAPGPEFVRAQAARLRPSLHKILGG